MNSTFCQDYINLVRMLRSYIAQEYSNDALIGTDLDTYAYFLKQAKNFKASAATFHEMPSPQFSPPLDVPGGGPQPAHLSVSEGIYASKSIPTAKKASPTDLRPQAATQMPPEIATKKLPETKTASFAASETSQKKTKSESKKFVCGVPPVPARPDFSEIRTFFEQHLPFVPLNTTIADDSHARKIASRWEEPPANIVILSFSELPKEQAFLENLTQALNHCLASTMVVSASKIEAQSGWEKLLKTRQLRLIIASNYNLYSLPGLMKYFREDSTGKHTLHDIQLYLLSDLSLYMQKPTLKASLWNSLCQIFK